MPLKLIAAEIVRNVAMRTEMHNGREHLVAPVILLVEGVHNEYYYPASAMRETAPLWNGVDVPIHHPKDDSGNYISVNLNPKTNEKCCVGRLWNVEFEEGTDEHPPRLKGEVWIDKEKLRNISPESFELMATDRMEVSTGLIATEDGSPGMWNDENYIGTLSNFIPDHLALLPGEKGACSWGDGCGIRANEFKLEHNENGLMKLDMFIRNSLKRIELNFLTNKESFEQVKMAIQQKLNSMDKPNMQPMPMLHYLEATFDDYFIYEVMGGSENDSGYYRMDYSINDNGEAEFSGEPVKVRPVKSYEEIKTNKKENNKMADEVKVGKECCKEVIDNIIANEATQYTEDDRKMLEELPEDVLKRMSEVPEPKAEVQANEDKDEGMTEEDIKKVIDANPAIAAAMKDYENKKKKIIESILANKRNVFTKEQLELKEMPELEGLASLAQVDVDYSLQAVHQNTVANDKDTPPKPMKEQDLWDLHRMNGGKVGQRIY